jgi:hypothetical protein
MKNDSATDSKTAPTTAQSQDPQYTQILLHNDLSALKAGALGEIPHDFKVPGSDSFRIIERGTGKYLETVGATSCEPERMLIAGDPLWRDYRLRAVVTPLTFEDARANGGICGIVARYAHSQDYIALVLDRDGHVKLLKRSGNRFDVLDSKLTEYCLGQSLTLTLKLSGDLIQGSAGPYSGATNVEARVSASGHGGSIGLIADVPARFGPFTIECSDTESARIAEAKSKSAVALGSKRKAVPKMRLDRTIPLHGLVNGPNLRLADVNGDGKPEIVVAQRSPSVATAFSATRLTCLSVLDLDGKLLWQAGVPDPAAPRIHEDLPFQVHDFFGDGGNVVACVIGYDVQIRDGKSGKLLHSATTPATAAVGSDFKSVTSSYGKPWGDESLNMDVSWLGFCNTQGNTGAREMIVKDDHHHLVVLDVTLQQLFRHRGNHGYAPWSGDLNGDGRDETFAGYSLIDAEGKPGWSAAIGPFPRALAVIDPLNAGGNDKRVFFCAGPAGLFAFNTKRLPKPEEPLSAISTVPASRLSIAKFRADLPGLQASTVSDSGTVALYDASGKLLWTREFFSTRVPGLPVNWTGKPEELLLTDSGLIDGRGDLLVEYPAPSSAPWVDTTSLLSADGRDSIIAWDEQSLRVYVSENTPLSGALYKPVRPGAENSSCHRARISAPPGWM